MFVCLVSCWPHFTFYTHPTVHGNNIFSSIHTLIAPWACLAFISEDGSNILASSYNEISRSILCKAAQRCTKKSHHSMKQQEKADLFDLGTQLDKALSEFTTSFLRIRILHPSSMNNFCFFLFSFMCAVSTAAPIPPQSPCLFTVEPLWLDLTSLYCLLEDWDWSPPPVCVWVYVNYVHRDHVFAPAGRSVVVCELAWRMLNDPQQLCFLNIFHIGHLTVI